MPAMALGNTHKIFRQLRYMDSVLSYPRFTSPFRISSSVMDVEGHGALCRMTNVGAIMHIALQIVENMEWQEKKNVAANTQQLEVRIQYKRSQILLYGYTWDCKDIHASGIANMNFNSSLFEEVDPRQAEKVTITVVQTLRCRYEVLCKIYSTARKPPGNMP